MQLMYQQKDIQKTKRANERIFDIFTLVVQRFQRFFDNFCQSSNAIWKCCNIIN